MIKKNCFLAGLGAVAIMLVSLSGIRADEWDKKTILVIDQPISIPGVVLLPGTYVFKLANSSSNRHIVQVFNKEQDQLIATIFAIPDRRNKRTSKTVLDFWEVSRGRPIALRSWFYPGDYRGFEFAYPKRQAMSIAALVREQAPILDE